MRDKKWFTDHLPADGSAQVHDLTSALYTVGVWGPRARDLVQSVTAADLSNAAFPFGTARAVDIGGVRTLMSRISYVGELGWEIYAPMEQGLRLWDTLWAAGQPLGVVPAGIGVYATTGRLEKGYRAHGNELELEFNLVEAGMARPTVKDADFIGKTAYLAQRAEPAGRDPVHPHRRRPDLVERGASATCSAASRSLTPTARRWSTRKGRRSYVTSAGSAPSIGKHILLAYLPPDARGRGHEARRRVLRRALPGDRRRRRQHARSSTRRTPRIRAAERGHPRLRQARARDGRPGHA